MKERSKPVKAEESRREVQAGAGCRLKVAPELPVWKERREKPRPFEYSRPDLAVTGKCLTLAECAAAKPHRSRVVPRNFRP